MKNANKCTMQHHNAVQAALQNVGSSCVGQNASSACLVQNAVQSEIHIAHSARSMQKCSIQKLVQQAVASATECRQDAKCKLWMQDAGMYTLGCMCNMECMLQLQHILHMHVLFKNSTQPTHLARIEMKNNAHVLDNTIRRLPIP